MLSAQNEIGTLKKLADFCIENYFKEINLHHPDKYKIWFSEIGKRTLHLMVEWSRVGFVHGVMNTDNMSIVGLSIDYGPFSMLDEFNLNFTPNTTDLPGRRYAFGKQPKIAQWNLWQLANALFPLIEDSDFFEKELENFGDEFWKKHDEMYGRKFGFETFKESDIDFFTTAQQLMQDLSIDYTLFFNGLATFLKTDHLENSFQPSFYIKPSKEDEKRFSEFLIDYKKRISENRISIDQSIEIMEQNNPKFILRNYLLYQCINELEQGKKETFQKILKALQNPYRETYPEFSQKRPDEYNDVAGCSTLSCSS